MTQTWSVIAHISLAATIGPKVGMWPKQDQSPSLGLTWIPGEDSPVCNDLKVGAGRFLRVLLSEGQAELKISMILGKMSLAGTAPHRNEGLRERRGEERSSLGERYHSPWLGWALEEDAPPPKARGWMGGPLSYSQRWKSPVCSRDANCLQPDTFLDLTERVEMRFKPLEAPPIPTSAGSGLMSG